MPQPTSTSRVSILNAFEQILAERRSTAFRVATREEEAEKEQNRQVLSTVAQYTTDTIVRGLADLQLDFSNTLNGLSTRLATETTKLDDLKRAIAIENQRLQELQKTRVVADALYLLTQEHQESLRQLEQQATLDRELLEQEMVRTRQLWEQEQVEFDSTVQESSQLLQQERSRQEADYSYETDRSRKIAMDEYEATQRQIERQIQETTAAKAKDWAEREQRLAGNQALLEDYQRQVDAFTNGLEEAIKKAREEGIRDASQDAKVKADLLEKEWVATQQGYELQIQSLEAKIQKQSEQIAETVNQLQTALRQAQDLAMRAFETSNRSAVRSESAA